MELTTFIKPEMMWLKVEENDRDAIFRLVAGEGERLGFVHDHFLTKLKGREEEFPTGLQLDGYGVAIPHTDPDCVIEQFIAVLTTDSAIPFQSMESKEKEVGVNVIFVLGLNEPHSQLEALQTLMAVIQDKANMKRIVEAETKEEVLGLLKVLAQK